MKSSQPVRNLNNPLIATYLENKSVGQPGMAPMPDDFPTLDEFVIAHREFLQTEHMLNTRDTNKLLLQAKNTVESDLLRYLSGIISTRKEYARFLMSGIEGCNKVIAGGIF